MKTGFLFTIKFRLQTPNRETFGPKSGVSECAKESGGVAGESTSVRPHMWKKPPARCKSGKKVNDDLPLVVPSDAENAGIT